MAKRGGHGTVAPPRTSMPSDVMFFTDNVGGEQKIKKRSSRPQMFCFPLKNIGGGQIKKKISE